MKLLLASAMAIAVLSVSLTSYAVGLETAGDVRLPVIDSAKPVDAELVTVLRFPGAKARSGLDLRGLSEVPTGRVVSLARHLLSCQLGNGGQLQISSVVGSRQAILSFDALAESATGAFKIVTPLKVEYTGGAGGLRYVSFVETGTWASTVDQSACSLRILFAPSNEALDSGDALPVKSSDAAVLNCGAQTFPIVSCFAGSDLQSLSDLLNFGTVMMED